MSSDQIFLVQILNKGYTYNRTNYASVNFSTVLQLYKQCNCFFLVSEKRYFLDFEGKRHDIYCKFWWNIDKICFNIFIFVVNYVLYNYNTSQNQSFKCVCVYKQTARNSVHIWRMFGHWPSSQTRSMGWSLNEPANNEWPWESEVTKGVIGQKWWNLISWLRLFIVVLRTVKSFSEFVLLLKLSKKIP